jgi:hypothetical protein
MLITQSGNLAVLTAVPTYHNDRFMARQHPGKAVAPYKPRRETLRDHINRVAQDSRNVVFGFHAFDRMEERGISDLDALRTLQFGDIVGEIEPGSRTGEWKCKVVAKRKGSRDVGVVTVVLNEGRLFIKTVEWEDL